MTAVTLRRYTNLAATVHLLRNRCLTLLNPESWDDRNDAYFLAQYKERTNASSVLALCFAEASETYHHWRVFSSGGDGVCIEFDRPKLLGFSITGVPLAEDSALIDAGLDLALGPNTTAGVSYSGQFGDGVQDNAVKGRFAWLF